MPQNAEDKLTTCCGSAVADRSKTTVCGAMRMGAVKVWKSVKLTIITVT
jgi:hypothetical protein